MIAVPVAVLHPDSPLPAEWNPSHNLKISAPLTAVTKLQLRRALNDGPTCRAVLNEHGVRFREMKDFEASDHCHIQNRVLLQKVGDARISPLETRCDMALRLAMWEQHGIRPVAKKYGLQITRLYHQGSYNCRKMRTGRGKEGRWSEHAVAGAIDIRAFGLSDGRQVALLRHWDGAYAPFLREVWKASCDWFNLVLSPEYNALHADHLHLQASGWGFCR